MCVVLTGQFKSHPMLYFSQQDVPSLREKAVTTHKHLADILTDAAKTMLANPKNYLPPTDYDKFSARWNEVYGNNLGAVAFYCVLYPFDGAARQFAIQFMDNLCQLPQWQVAALPNDEVPVAHTFTGFTTAYDFLYEHLDTKRRQKFLERIETETKEFDRYSRFRSWGKFYLQNHVATNYLSLIHGCLVLQVHTKSADMWLTHAVKNFERTMFLLNQIVDGSLDEGVAYGSYTSRSVTQYAFLALRHWKIDHTQDFWFKEHFNFYFYTMWPGFQKNVAIADSNYNWFYGPESQLVFLDTFIMRNGYGNWLASEIRKHRVAESKPNENNLAASSSQRWCTIHTEFLWYDPSLGQKAPLDDPVNTLHTFTDWGVATYSKFSPDEKEDTFVAFKSGKLHGRAIFDVVNGPRYKTWVREWFSFNPGHEHPDQNMFLFAPNGQSFITDALYGQKHTFLNNVLMFGPSDLGECVKPWVGQLGECDKWLKWKLPESKKYSGELITSETTDNIVHISGEAKDAYNSALRLKSVYRNIMLLNPDLLFVIDHIEVEMDNTLKYVSAFFHNTEVPFEDDIFSNKIQGAKISVDGKEYKMAWMKSDGASPVANLQINQYPSQWQKVAAKFVNVTFELSKSQTRIMYVFVSPRIRLLEMKFVKTSEHLVVAHLVTNQISYTISLMTTHMSPVIRYQNLGSSRFAKVETSDGKVVVLGKDNSKEMKQQANNIASENAALVVSTISISVLLLGSMKFYRLLRSQKLRVIFVIVLFIVISILLYSALNVSSSIPQTPINTEQLPRIIITSLPASGAEILSQMFQNNPDFLYLTVPSNVMRTPDGEIDVNSFTDVCTSQATSKHPKTAEWLQSIIRQPRNFIKYDIYDEIMAEKERQMEQMKPSKKKKRHVDEDDTVLAPLVSEDVNFKEYTDEAVIEHSRQYPDALPVLELSSGSWPLALPWLHDTLKQDNLHSLHVVCDPRMWINNLLIGSPSIYEQLGIQRSLYSALIGTNEQTRCKPQKRFAQQFDSLRNILISTNMKPHRLLAQLWLAHTTVVMETQKSASTKMMLWEDLIKDPEFNVQEIYRFIDMPVRPVVTHQMLQATRSDVYTIPYLGVIGQDSLHQWKTQLTIDQIRDIEEICSVLMTDLGYTKFDMRK
ncbi:dermatan-sulfate epimerase-like protein [Glandiceps talaboti]